MRIVMFLGLCLAFSLACGGETGVADSAPTDREADSDTDTDSDSDTDSDTDADCATVNSGDDWAWSGECPQMATPCDIVVDGCEMKIDYRADGGMTMGMPKSGVIEGDEVTFGEENGVDDCVGTVETADRITGTCQGGCTFKLRR